MQDYDKGMAKAKKIYENRERRVKELGRQGERIIGYFCNFAPPELITAAGLVPFRLTGDPMTTITVADAYIESTTCPYVRNLFDQALRGYTEFLHGLVLSHSCDSVLRVSGLWAYYLKPVYFHVVNVPHNLSNSSKLFFKNELKLFKMSLEKFTGEPISEEKIRQAIKLYNQTRFLVGKLYGKAKEDPPLISGSEMRQVLVAGLSLPPVEFNVLLEEVLQEIESRPRINSKTPRLLVYGSIIDRDILPRLIEECGGVIVTDDTCIGTRIFREELIESSDLFEDLVKYYLEDFVCPRTVRSHDYSQFQYIKATKFHDDVRFQYIKNLIDEFKVDGVILYALEYCDPHKFDIPSIMNFLSKEGVPSLYLQDDYTMSNIQSMKTRIQAFVEMLG